MTEEKKQTQKTEETPPKDFMGMLEFYFVKKAPFQIPDNIKEWTVKYGPWVMLALIILSLPGIFFALGVSLFATPWIGAAYTAGLSFALVLSIVQMGIMLAAIPGLLARKISGWKIALYATFFGAISGLVQTFSGNFGSIVWTLIGLAFGLYVLFQIRPLYKK